MANKYSHLGFGLLFLLPMKANHIVKRNFKGRNMYILTKDEASTVRVKSWNLSFSLPQQGEKMKYSVIKLEMDPMVN